MASFNALIASLQLQEWFVLSIPFVVMTGVAVWLLTPAGEYWGERVLRGGFGAARARRSLRRVVPQASPSEDATSGAVDDPAPALVMENVTLLISDISEPCAISGAEVEAASVTLDTRLINKRCKMDLAATSGGLELTVELPGVEEKDLKVQVADDVLTISGHVSFEPDREERNYRLVERDYGTFTRSIDLPAGIAADRIQASLSYGVLTLKIPNPTKPAPMTIDIQGPSVGWCETADGLRMSVDLPGLDQGEVDVSMSNRLLTVSGAVRAELGVDAAPHRPCGNHHRPLSRSVALPDWVNPDQIVATLNNGVLAISIPHPATLDPKRIEVRTLAAPTIEQRGNLAPVGERQGPAATVM